MGTVFKKINPSGTETFSNVAGASNEKFDASEQLFVTSQTGESVYVDSLVITVVTIIFFIDL